MRLTIGLLPLALAVSWAGAAQAQQPSPEAVQLYNTYCVQCHGVNRNGNGVNSGRMAVKPRDHSDTKSMADTPDKEFFSAIKNGGLSVNKSVLMPTWGGVLSDAQIKELVAYLRVVSKTTSH